MSRARSEPEPVAGLALGLGLVVAVTVVLLPFRTDISRATPALVLVIPVVVAGLRGGRAAAIFTAAAGAVAFSLAFIPPVGTLRVALSEDLVALLVFTIVAIAVGTLVAREADKRRAAEQRAEEIEAMHIRYQSLVAEQQSLREEADRAVMLQRVDDQRAAMLRSVSHDLRTPLASIRAVASDLRDGAVHHTDSIREELLDVVCDEAERLDRLVGNLLSLSRIEAGAFHPDRQAVVPDELVGDVVRRLGRLLADVRLEVCLPDGLPMLDVDYLQVDQVMTNLLENAARHSPAGGTVRVSAERAGASVAVVVTDEGAGIDLVDLDRVFEPFRTGRGSTSTGVGLAICKAIVEAHGGTISVSNLSDGGAQFRFTLPVRDGR